MWISDLVRVFNRAVFPPAPVRPVSAELTFRVFVIVARREMVIPVFMMVSPYKALTPREWSREATGGARSADQNRE